MSVTSVNSAQIEEVAGGELFDLLGTVDSVEDVKFFYHDEGGFAYAVANGRVVEIVPSDDGIEARPSPHVEELSEEITRFEANTTGD